MLEIKVPTVGESINEVTLVKWLKKEGDYVNRDELLCELESEKATFELNAEQAGVLHIVAQEGATLNIGDTACKIDESAARPEAAAKEKSSEKTASKDDANKQKAAGASSEKPGVEARSANVDSHQKEAEKNVKASPVARNVMTDKKLEPTAVKGSGANGKILKHDVLEALQNPGQRNGAEAFSRNERREKMSNLRKTVSRRLVEAKNTTAMLTTFNEVDMSRIMEIRTAYKEKFKTEHGVGLGFMSFFIKACCIGLNEWPAVNAYIDGEEIVYHDYCDISIAVSAPKGLVVPVIRNAESLSMAQIEQEVINLATKARDNKLTMEEMTGGTFTVTNGGVFGSMLSTPIINIPQSAILGMHKIEQRPVVVDGQIVARPMMYLAVSYDHRIIDGRESVSFLVRLKELLEYPELLLIGKDPVEALLF